MNTNLSSTQLISYLFDMKEALDGIVRYGRDTDVVSALWRTRHTIALKEACDNLGLDAQEVLDFRLKNEATTR